MKERLLVTGHSGLMGTHFVSLIEKDPRYELKLFEGDITRKVDVARNMRNIDTVIHFAALTFPPFSWGEWDAYNEVNYKGTMNLIENHDLFKKFVYLSTSHMYGNQTKFPILEGNLQTPNDPYAITKRAATDAAFLWASRYKFDILVIRPFNNFGPHQSTRYVIPTMILQALKTGKIIIKGNTQREFIYVKDNVRAIKELMLKGSTGTVHICQGKCWYIAAVARMILEALGLDPSAISIEQNARPMDIKKLLGEPKEMYAQLPDFKFTPIKQAIKETIEFYRDGVG